MWKDDGLMAHDGFNTLCMRFEEEIFRMPARSIAISWELAE